jgi:hypothetical protein
MSVRISKQYGLNPSVTHCECCGKEIGIALFGTSWKDKNGKTAEAPRNVAMGLCDDCQKVVDAQGLMIIEVRDGESGKNPYRTGRLIGITKEAKERMFKDISSPIVFMEQSMFSQLFRNVQFNQ